MSHYWDSVMEKRLTRRRALAATGATTLGAAMLAGWVLVDAYWVLALTALVCAVASHVPRWEQS